MNWFFVLLLVAGGFIVFGVSQIMKESRDWNAYKVEHSCRIVGKRTGDVITTFTDGKVGIGTTPGKTGWLCDDGVTYWR